MKSMRLVKPRGRRYDIDRQHPYGWEICFEQSVILPSGKEYRVTFRDIGSDRDAAISNAFRSLCSESSIIFYEKLANRA